MTTIITSDFLADFKPEFRKGDLASILIFGATSDIGGNAAKLIHDTSPNTLLRIATSAEKNLTQLQQAYPNAEVVVANYYDLTSLEAAFNGMEGMLMVTPDFTDEQLATGNVVKAAKKWAVLKHMIRIIGEAPGMRLKYVPKAIANRPRWEGGAMSGHPRARDILTKANMPVTYLNMAAYLMKNLIRDDMFRPCIEQWRCFAMAYDHPTPLIDSREVGEVAGKLLLSPDHRHIHTTYDLDNGVDMLSTRKVAQITGEELGVEIGFVGDDLEEYARVTGQHPLKTFGMVLQEYSAYEWDFANRFYLSDLHQRLLGRKPITLRAWLQEHKDQFDLSVYQ